LKDAASPPDFDTLLQVASDVYGHKLSPDSILAKVIQQVANGDTTDIKDKIEYFKNNPDSQPYKAYKAVYDFYTQSQPQPEPQSTITPKADFATIANDVKNAGYTSPMVKSAAGDMIQACLDSNSLVPFEEFKKTNQTWADEKGDAYTAILSKYIQPANNTNSPSDVVTAAHDIYTSGGIWTKNLKDEDKALALAALETTIETGNPDPIFDLFKTTDMASTGVNILKMAALKKHEELEQAKLQAPSPTFQFQPPEPAEPVNNHNVIHTNNDDVDQFLSGALNAIGVDASKFTPDAQTELGKATSKALTSPTEVGVIVAFNKLAKMGAIPESVLTELKYQILEKLKSQGQLYTGPDAFKKTFDHDQFLQDIVSGEVNAPQVDTSHKEAFNNFYNALTDQQKQQLVAAMKHGMSLDTSKQASEYYEQTLGQLPGWNEKVSEAWRRSLRYLHDEFKNAAELELKKKAELEAQKKAEEELKKVWASLGAVGGPQVVQSVMKGAGLDKLSASVQKQVADAAVKALAAPTTQEMFDELNKLRGYSAYQGSSGGKYGVLNQTQFDMLRDLMTNVFFNAKYQSKNPPENVVEPKVTVPTQDRIKSVLATWQKKHGYSLAHLPNTSYQERQKLLAAVTNALTEPNPKLVNNHLNKLLASTSLTDDQVDALRMSVHAERQEPASLTGKAPQLHEPKPHSAAQSTLPSAAPTGQIATTLKKHPEFLQKLKYYGISPQHADAVHDVMIDGMNFKIYDAVNKSYKSKQIANKLMALGLSADTAKNFANWTTLQAQKGSEIAQKAQQLKAASQQPASGGFGTLPVGTPKNIPVSDQATAKQYVINIPASADSYGYIKKEMSKGEVIKVNSGTHFQLENKSDGDSNHCVNEAIKQEAWRVANIKKTSPELYKQFNDAANSWQGSSQWSKTPEHRKAMNTVFTKTIEGPPPMLTKVEKFVERGVNVSAKDFGDFIKLFNVGERVYIGPSGFSANHSTAESFMGGTGLDTDHVKVMLRVKPPASGMIKAARLHNRPGDNHPSEEELVLGTNNCTRVSRVIKHVTEYYGQHYVNYEIEMDWDDSLNEQTDTYGFQSQYWKGVPPATIKAIIKYMNSSVNTKY
jgi:hypothetical protein